MGDALQKALWIATSSAMVALTMPESPASNEPTRPEVDAVDAGVQRNRDW